jgi:hypothetical protein
VRQTPERERLDEIRQEAERVHESAMLSSETQFEYAKRWRRADRWISVAASVLAGIAGVGGISKIISIQWAGFVAILSAVAAAVAASLGAPKTKEKAAIAANAYRALQQDCRIFIQVDLPALSDSDARERLQSLVDRLQELNKEAEIPSSRAWERAKKAIGAGSQRYGVDE